MSCIPMSRTMRSLSPLLQRVQRIPARSLTYQVMSPSTKAAASSTSSILDHTPRLEPLRVTPAQHRPFSSSPHRPAKAIINPRKSEEGEDMIIDITPRASDRLYNIAKTDSNPSLCLRVSVESGGCHGFQYLMSLTSVDNISHEEDTVFESEDGKGAKVVMDEPSLELLKGSKIDYSMELIGSQFKVTGIPGAKSSCGCGTSFDIQM